MIVLYFSYKSVKASLFVLLLISPKEPFKDCFALTCELELLLDSVTKDEFYRIFDETYRFCCFCCFYFYFYLSFSFWTTSLCNCWLIFYIYCFMRLFSLLSFRFYFSSYVTLSSFCFSRFFPYCNYFYHFSFSFPINFFISSITVSTSVAASK